jgi:asparagine synthase (glutamine-hydrolysing)
MPTRTLAAIHDPLRRLPAGETERRLRAGMMPEGDAGIRADEAFGVAWTGPAPAMRGASVVVVDGAATSEALLQPTTGPADLRDLRGGFAVVAWDGTRGLLARDQMGSRPLFSFTDGQILYAASEVSVLLRLLTRRPSPDLDRLALWVAGRPGPDTGTLFAGVSAVPPAHALVLESDGHRVERYWAPRPQDADGLDAETAATQLRDGALAAVRRSIDPTVECGVLLSGGLDSSTVLACAAAEARATGRRAPVAFTATFPGRRELDESAASRAAAQHAGAGWVTVPAAEGPNVPEALAYAERWQLPLSSPNLAVFRPAHEAAARSGVELLLDGEGGDELFGCEPLLLADRVLAGRLRGALELARSLPGMERLDRRRLRVVLSHWLLPGVVPPRALATLRSLRRREGSTPKWLREPASRVVNAAEDGGWWRRGEPRWRSHLRWLLTDARATMAVQDELRRAAATAGGVPTAHPFLDVDLVELVLGLPPEPAFDRRLDRALLRRAMVGLLPEDVRLREDKVFFNELVVDALCGADREPVEAALGDDRLELGAVAVPEAVRKLWRDGPEGHERGRHAWALEVWRVFAAETWLRREAGRPAIGP